MFKLAGRKALVTGAGQGMGVGIAQCLAACGARLYINDLQPHRAERVAQSFREENFEAEALAFDVTDLDAYQDAVNNVNGIDILVNNAGIVTVDRSSDHFGKFSDSNPAGWQKQFDLNVFGVMNGIHAVVPGMREKQWGRIITIGSDSGRKGTTRLGAYSASKAAGQQITRCVAVEEGEFGITANTVSLGLMENAVAANISPEMTAYFDGLLRETPVSRAGKGTDVGAAVAFLASEEAAWTTGQNIGVNGGFDTF